MGIANMKREDLVIEKSDSADVFFCRCIIRQLTHLAVWTYLVSTFCVDE